MMMLSLSALLLALPQGTGSSPSIAAHASTSPVAWVVETSSPGILRVDFSPEPQEKGGKSTDNWQDNCTPDGKSISKDRPCQPPQGVGFGKSSGNWRDDCDPYGRPVSKDRACNPPPGAQFAKLPDDGEDVK